MISALSAAPALTTAPPSLVRNPQLVVRTIVTPQATGVLILESVPSGASVYVDDTLRGTTPLTLRAITTGVHPISFTLTGYQNYTTKATVTAGAVATSSATLAPVITATSTPSVSTPAAGVIPVPVTTTRETVPTAPPVTTVFPVVTRVTQQSTSAPAGPCTRHYFGSGEMGTSPDGRLNCTVIISTDDRIGTLSAQEGTRATDAGKNPVPEIHIVPVTASEITPAAGPHDSTWTGHAYHFLPDHASFDPPVLVSFTLSQDEWERSDPANLTIQETNETGPGWERLPTRIDPLTRTISAPARHFSIIGLFSTGSAGNPPENQPSPAEVTCTVDRICPGCTAIIPAHSG